MPAPTTAIANGRHPSPGKGKMQSGAERVGTVEEADMGLLPEVKSSMVPLSFLLERLIGHAWKELGVLVETLPSLPPAERAPAIATYALNTRSQVLKLLALSKWAHAPTGGAQTIATAHGVNAFLQLQTARLQSALEGLQAVGAGLGQARVCNSDILTALEVLQTGTYSGLPSQLTKTFVPPSPIPVLQVVSTLADLDDIIRYRLRTREVVPAPMRAVPWRVSDGRVYFTVPGLFECSLTLSGRKEDAIWFLLSVEFLIQTDGKEEYTRNPTLTARQEILDLGNAELAACMPPASGKRDAPLARVYNFLQNLALSYQLEILHTQATRLRASTWSGSLNFTLSPDRQTLSLAYWLRTRPSLAPRPGQAPPPPQLVQGGALTIALVPVRDDERPPLERVLQEVEEGSKGEGDLGDAVQLMKLGVEWVREDGVEVPDGVVRVDPSSLSLERLLLHALNLHASALLQLYHSQLTSPRSAFPPSSVSLSVPPDSVPASPTTLDVRLYDTHVLRVSVAPRTGKLVLRDTADGTAPVRARELLEKINVHGGGRQRGELLVDLLVRLRHSSAMDAVEQKAIYLGLETHRRRNISKQELSKFGTAARYFLFISLAGHANHHLVFIMSDVSIAFALIATRAIQNEYAIDQIGWLDRERICGAPAGAAAERDGLALDVQELRALYAYCIARVSYLKIEQQLKARGIPYAQVDPSAGAGAGAAAQTQAQTSSRLMRHVPALSVQARHLLPGGAAADVALPHVAVRVTDWWGDRKCKVLTSVKLRAKPPTTPDAPASASASSTTPSDRVSYDPASSVLTFTSEDVETCVGDFLEQWARVAKVAVVAREVERLRRSPRFPHLALVAFDMQTVTFAYHPRYIASVRWHVERGSYMLDFGTRPEESKPDSAEPGAGEADNPHSWIADYLAESLNTSDDRGEGFVERFLHLLADTLSILQAADALEQDPPSSTLRVEAVPRSAAWLRLTIGSRHALDVRLLAQSRILLSDGSLPAFPHSTSSELSIPTRLSTIDDFPDLVRSTIAEIASDSTAKLPIRPDPAAEPPLLAFREGLVCTPAHAARAMRALVGRVCAVVEGATVGEGREKGSMLDEVEQALKAAG